MADDTIENRTRWNNLDELHECALRAGCPESVYQKIIEEVGSNPFDVATRLQSKVLDWTPRRRYL